MFLNPEELVCKMHLILCYRLFFAVFLSNYNFGGHYSLSVIVFICAPNFTKWLDDTRTMLRASILTFNSN